MDQWASYDDLPTFKMKIDYANEVCLGGIMVWAVDLDDANATMTNELAQAMGLPADSKAVQSLNITLPGMDPGLLSPP